MKQPLSILITGCDSGFGKLTAERLNQLGYKIFAACLTQEGIKGLPNGVKGFIMDVTKQSDVDKAFQFVQKEIPKGLDVLINNAGILLGSLIEWTTMEEYQKMMDVNFFGMVRVTLAFLPLIRKVQGKIINITSMAGYFVPPSMAGYGATKHAAEGFTDGLRRELKNFGIKVVIIEPTAAKTSILQYVSLLDQAWKSIDFPPGKNFI